VLKLENFFFGNIVLLISHYFSIFSCYLKKIQPLKLTQFDTKSVKKNLHHSLPTVLWNWSLLQYTIKDNRNQRFHETLKILKCSELDVCLQTTVTDCLAPTAVLVFVGSVACLAATYCSFGKNSFYKKFGPLTLRTHKPFFWRVLYHNIL